MEAGKRIIVNTLVQYARSVATMLLSLFSTRYMLASLGKDGFGVFSVVGSFVVMMSFLTTSLAGSTQRFLNYSHGLEDKNEVRVIFANAMWLHIGIALLLECIMFILGFFMMDFLVVPDGMREATTFVYYMVLLMVLLTFVTAPVRALFIARENITFVSVVEVCDAVLKLGGAVALPFIPFDSLKLYSAVLASLSIVNLVVYASFAGVKYEECCWPRLNDISRRHIKQLTGFAVWNIYSVGSTVVRTQGLAMVINRFLTTVGNAAYGVAQQVSNAVGVIAMSILNAVNPQLMRAEGAGDRERMLTLSTKESKYSFLVLSLLLIPLIMEMPEVLSFWLKDVPDYACVFCQFILIDYIWDQTTIGLTSANQAIGKIRNYSLLISTTRLMVLPLAWFCLSSGLPAVSVMIAYLAVDIVIGMMRIPFLHYTGGLSVRAYCQEVYLRGLPVVCGIFVVAWMMTSLPNFPFRFVVTELVSVCAGIVLIYCIALTSPERNWIQQKLLKRRAL